MNVLERRALLILFFMIQATALAQVSPGFRASGTVRDKENNHTLNSATVSLFDADSTLLSFQITNSYGNFSFNLEKVKYPCQLRISNVGYAIKVIDFKLPAVGPIELGEIELVPQNIQLNEVVVSLAPVTLNGDTLEFNPTAFKLDSTAVLDDLLRKIPNVTIWNDGQITVNGREIRSLVVNGKPFFGTDFRVVTGNLPNNVIEKIQVYRKGELRANPLDSIMEMNILLKEGMERGFFGKLTAGLGSQKHYETEGNINYFTRRLQLSLAGAANTTNKVADDMQTLLKNSTFKNSVSDIEYSSNFKLPGVNTVHHGGASFTYNFLEKSSPDKRNELSGSYFRQGLEVREQAGTTALRSLGIDRQSLEFDDTRSDKKADKDKLAVRYQFSNTLSSLDVYAQRSAADEDHSTLASTLVQDESKTALSSYTGRNTLSDQNVKYSVAAYYQYHPQLANSEVKRRQFLPFDLSYQGSLSDHNISSGILSSFVSTLRPADNIDFNRTRYSNGRVDQQRIDVAIHDLERLLSPAGASKLNLWLIANLDINRNRNSDLVNDISGGMANPNDYLSITNSEFMRKFYYGLGISKQYRRLLTDRFDKSTSLALKPRMMDISFSSRSENKLQQIRRHSSSFFPSAELTVYRNIFGKHLTNFKTAFASEINFPTLQILAPLTDSTRMYNLRMSNVGLNQERIQSLRLSFSREPTGKTNALIYSLEAGMSFSSDKIADSIQLLPDNRQRIYPVNLDGYRQFLTSAAIRKSIKLKSSDLKFQLNTGLSRTTLPAYINSALVVNKQESAHLTADIGYGFSDLLEIGIRSNVYHYRSDQAYFSRTFDGTTFIQTLGALWRVRPGLTLTSNIDLNMNRSSGVPTTRFTIWNVYVSQRLFKERNVEFRISGLDLLDQNKNVINLIGINSFSTTVRNSLQRYVLFSLSWYPRKYGNDRP